jgi:hypothetical protein
LKGKNASEISEIIGKTERTVLKTYVPIARPV